SRGGRRQPQDRDRHAASGRRRGRCPRAAGWGRWRSQDRARRRARAGRFRGVKTLLRGVLHGARGADAVLIEGELITWVGRGEPPQRPDEEVVAGLGEVIAPGFIDLQVNGYAGHDAAAGADAIAAISNALPATGVTAFLPTIISAPVEVGAEFAAAVGAAAEATGARVLGAHIEGPFLNPSFRGAHLRSHLAEPTAANAPAGTYELSGRPVHSDGRVVRLEDGTLAGSAAAMPDLLRLMSRLPGMTPRRAVSLASMVPARVLGERRLGRIGEGACADIVILDAEMRPRLTMIRGVVKFR